MNQIVVRTHKGEYLPGEDIFGVVYLKIASATTASGINLKIVGKEKILYRIKKETAWEEYKNIKENIEFYEKELLKNNEPLLLGCYAYPFKIRLPSNVPGSFEFVKNTKILKCETEISYALLVYCVDATNVQTQTPIIVSQPLPIGYKDGDQWPGVSKQLNVPIPYFPLIKRQLFLTVKLLSAIQFSGECLQVKIIITNNTKLNVQSIIVKLIRDLTLTMKRGTLKSSQGFETLPATHNHFYITPEEGCTVVWQQEIKGCNPDVLNIGLDNFCIPLKTEDNENIPCCVDSVQIQCRYMMEIVVQLQRNYHISAEMKIPCIRHSKNEQWSSQSFPGWVTSAAIKTTESPLSVPASFLSSEAFSKFPGFQTLKI